MLLKKLCTKSCPKIENPLKISAIFFSALLIQSCGSLLPGMQNLHKGSIPVVATPSCPMQPVIIPINPGSLAQQPCQTAYRVAPADILSIHVFKHPEFNLPSDGHHSLETDKLSGVSGYLVSPEGRIYFPLIGNVLVAGKTVSQVRRQLIQALRAFIPHPEVFVRVADYRSHKFYVMGEVVKPGFFTLTDQPLSLIDALNLAGSFDQNTSDPSHIYVLRGPIERPRIFWLNVHSPAALLLAERFTMRRGDIVVVSTAPVARWNRFLNQLLPTLQTIWYTKAITGNYR